MISQQNYAWWNLWDNVTLPLSDWMSMDTLLLVTHGGGESLLDESESFVSSFLLLVSDFEFLDDIPGKQRNVALFEYSGLAILNGFNKLLPYIVLVSAGISRTCIIP